MGALRLYSQRSAVGAKGGIIKGMMTLGAKGALRSIPGVGMATTVLGAGKALLPKKPGFATGLVTGMASGPATRTATAAARSVARQATQAFTGPRKKYRRQNPANVKALRRAVRRIEAAEKLFRSVLSVQGKKSTGIKTKKKGR